MSVAEHLGIRTREYDQQILTFTPFYEEILDQAAAALDAVERPAKLLVESRERIRRNWRPCGDGGNLSYGSHLLTSCATRNRSVGPPSAYRRGSSRTLRKANCTASEAVVPLEPPHL
jgi:hypothetical protein